MSYSSFLAGDMTVLQYLTWLRDQTAFAVYGWEALILMQKEKAAIYCTEINVNYFMDSVECAREFIDKRLRKELEFLEKEIQEETEQPKNISIEDRLLLLLYEGDEFQARRPIIKN